MSVDIHKTIRDILNNVGVTGEIELSTPPNPEMGDFAFACFSLAKEQGKNPVEMAKEISEKLKAKSEKVIERAQAVGPYVNFFINPHALAESVFKEIDENYGKLTIGKKKKILVEFGCPNPLKVFHLGHLKNLITGESIARILENAGFDVVRVNYQGDVGMHVAKAMWAMENHKSQIINLKSKSLQERIVFLGKMYAEGARAFEDEEEKKEIVAMNKRVYEKDPEIQDLYKLTVGWSLEYFDEIYKKLGTHFDRLYMESEVFEPGARIVKEHVASGVFKESDGAIIYEGSKHGLHDRVFINSEGFPTYEAKDIGLAEAHFADHNPDTVIHVVGKEQAEYFKVVFAAIAELWPEREGKEVHVPGGYLQLKGEKKMSSRTGNVIAGDELLVQVEERVKQIMQEGDTVDKDNTLKRVTNAVLKYGMLKSDVRKDVAFDLEESISVSGDSGPYLLYVVARIKSILKKSDLPAGKAGIRNASRQGGNQKCQPARRESEMPTDIHAAEKQLLFALAEFPDRAAQAANEYDPSCIAQYLFNLAQTFNSFYTDCPVLQADDKTKVFRVHLIGCVEYVMIAGLHLLGIEPVEEM